MFKCKRCESPAISLLDKYKAGLWQEVYCPNCQARLADNPYILGAFHFCGYVQIVAWFVLLAYMTKDLTYLAYLAATWLIFDVLNVMFVPLVILKPKPAAT